MTKGTGKKVAKATNPATTLVVTPTEGETKGQTTGPRSFGAVCQAWAICVGFRWKGDGQFSGKARHHGLCRIYPFGRREGRGRRSLHGQPDARSASNHAG